MKRRIALVVNSLSGGGAERTVSNLSRELSERYDVDLVLNDEEHADYPYEGRLLSLGMPPESERMGAGYQLRALVRRTRLLRQLKKSGRYAAVLSFSEMANAANVLSGRGAKTIASVRISTGRGLCRDPKMRLYARILLPLVCRRADLTVSCSREIAEELIAGYGLPEEKSAVICNGLPLEEIRARAAAPLPEWEARTDARLLVTAGRLSFQKGQWHLLPVMKALRDAGLPVRLVILGEGELRPLLEERIARLGLEDCVSLPGFVDNPYAWLARADAVLMPSLYEGFSNVILEALACGAPVIATDHETGAREILAPDTDHRRKVKDRIEKAACGILTPVCPGGPEEGGVALTPEERLLAEAVRELLEDEALAARYRQASRERAEQLAIGRICEQWIEAIETR